jgi:hypothetical protein
MPWAIPDLAREWKCSPEQIELWGAYGGLQIVALPTGSGSQVRAVLPEEKARYEGDKRRFPEGRYNPTERDSHLLLIGALAVAYTGGDVRILREPGRLVSDIAQCAAANGCALVRGTDTNIKALSEAIALLTAKGAYSPDKLAA